MPGEASNLVQACAARCADTASRHGKTGEEVAAERWGACMLTLSPSLHLGPALRNQRIWYLLSKISVVLAAGSAVCACIRPQGRLFSFPSSKWQSLWDTLLYLKEVLQRLVSAGYHG